MSGFVERRHGAGAPFLSVVTPTHDRRDSILRLLDRLRDGTYPAGCYEAVVVADGCSDDTVATLRAEAAAGRWPFPLEVLEQTPGRGAAAARNLGAAQARGEVLVFVDDDIEPLPRLLEQHAAQHLEGDDAVVVGAPLPVREPPVGGVDETAMSLDLMAPWAWWEQQFEHMVLPGHRFRYEEVFSGILSVRAERFARAGGFQVDFNSCRDDSELGYRLFLTGGRVAFARDGGGWHHEQRTHERLVVRKRAEGRADALLAAGHPELWPVLRLSWPQRPWWSALGLLRRLAFGARGVGDVVAGAGMRMMEWVARWKLRGSWRVLNSWVMHYQYWRGVATHLGSARAFAALAERAEGEARAVAARAEGEAPEVDLAEGVEAAERRLDRLAPLALRVRFGPYPVGVVRYVPGAEPIRGRHLRRLLATELAWPLATVLALVERAPVVPDERHAIPADAVAGR